MKNKTSNYAIQLAKTLIKHASEDELKYLIKQFEIETQRICQNRPAQGLHDASYHLYCKHYL